MPPPRSKRQPWRSAHPGECIGAPRQVVWCNGGNWTVSGGQSNATVGGMSAPVPHDLQSVWEYPLFEALFGRRSRRFGRGFAMTEGPFQYTSPHPPLPLSELEEA